jgi:hypothetical protein
MLNEGNNCVFLSNYIKNVAIRWNKDFHVLKFDTTNYKREVEVLKETIKQSIISEIIVELSCDEKKEIRKI